MTKFQPFADDTASLSINDLTIENGTDKIAVYGSLEVTRDKEGLDKARSLKNLMNSIVRALEREKELPDQVGPVEATQPVKNPFA